MRIQFPTKLINSVRVRIKEQNAHYITLKAMDLLNEADYIISNTFPTNQSIADYERYLKSINSAPQINEKGKRQESVKRLGDALKNLGDFYHWDSSNSINQNFNNDSNDKKIEDILNGEALLDDQAPLNYDDDFYRPEDDPDLHK